MMPVKTITAAQKKIIWSITRKQLGIQRDELYAAIFGMFEAERMSALTYAQAELFTPCPPDEAASAPTAESQLTSCQRASRSRHKYLPRSGSSWPSEPLGFSTPSAPPAGFTDRKSTRLNSSH